jgi:hypothetical protein
LDVLTKTIRNRIVKANKSYSLGFERIDHGKSYGGLDSPPPASQLRPEIPFSVRRCVWWHHRLFLSASFCLRGPDGHPPGPSMPPVYSAGRWKAKFQWHELSNLSSRHTNLVVAAHTHQQAIDGDNWGAPMSTCMRSTYRPDLQGVWIQSSLDRKALSYVKMLPH